MRASTLAKPSLMFAMAGLAMPAHATAVMVSYSPTATGAAVTVASTSPTFTIFTASTTTFVGAPKSYITANSITSIAGTPHYGSGTYGFTFNVGAQPYVGTYTEMGDHISQVDTSAVPEPASWAMLLLGMGAIGAALRTRRQDQTANA